MKLYTKFLMLCAALICFATAQAQQLTHPMIFVVNSPSSLQGSIPYGYQTDWGPTTLPTTTGQLVWAYDITPDSLVCDTITNDYTGKVAMVNRGTCNFSQKALAVQRAGAIACVICNNNGGTDVINMAGGTFGPQVTIPAIMISSQNCALLAASLANGDSISVTFRKPFVSSPVGAFGYDTPEHHIQALTGMNVDITNASSTAATNVITTLTVTAPDGAQTVFMDTTASVLVDSTVNVSFAGPFVPTDTGLYTMVFKSTLDGNDSATTSFHINANQFTLDRQSNYTWIGVTDAGYATANYRFDMGNVYLAGPNGGAATHATFALGNNTGTYMGQIFNVRLYLLPTNLAGSEQDYSTFTLVGVAVDTIDAADTTPYTLITKPLIDINSLADSVSLLADRQYMLVVNYQGTSAIPAAPRFSYFGSDEFLSIGTTVFTDRLYMGGFSGNPHPVIRLQTREYSNNVAVTQILETKTFNLFPNPAKDVVNIDLSLPEMSNNVNVSLVDINGRILQQYNYANFTQQNLQFNTSELTSGFYFVRIQTDKGVQVKEFSKK